MNDITFKRKVLYDLVWSKPMNAIAKTYFIKDVFLRKICTEMKIPVPKNGHWQKLKFGKSVEIEPLPADYSGDNEMKFTLGKNDAQDSAIMLSPETALLIEIQNDPNVSFTVPNKLTHATKLIISAKESLTNRKDRHLYNGLMSMWKEKLSILVAPENTDRALRFMDTFSKLLINRGHKSIKDDFNSIDINGEIIHFGLREKLKRVPETSTYGYQSFKLIPTGILIFYARIDFDKMIWMDGKQIIENQLAKILMKFEMQAKRCKEQKIKWEKLRQIQREDERIKKELAAIKEKDLADSMQLLTQAKQWQEANMLRKYLDNIEETAVANNEVSEELEKWLCWARNKADSLDPMTIGKR